MMHAQAGDWLIVHGRVQGQPERRAQILRVGPSGAPPYAVRWTDDDRNGIVFPGPDAEIVTSEQLFHELAGDD